MAKLCDPPPMPTTKPAADFTYTDQELLNLWREALAVISIKGSSYKIGSREYTFHDLDHVLAMVKYFEERVAAETTGIAVNLARFDRPS